MHSPNPDRHFVVKQKYVIFSFKIIRSTQIFLHILRKIIPSYCLWVIGRPLLNCRCSAFQRYIFQPIGFLYKKMIQWLGSKCVWWKIGPPLTGAFLGDFCMMLFSYCWRMPRIRISASWLANLMNKSMKFGSKYSSKSGPFRVVDLARI